jgi:hypothetical protein
MNKKSLSERDICTKFITPAIEKAGWDTHLQILEEVSFTDGKIYVRGKITARGTRKRADYILYYKPNIPIAIIEAKDNMNISSIPAICIFTEIGGCGGSFSIPMGQFTPSPLSCLSPGCPGCSCLASPTSFGYIYSVGGSTGCTPGWDLYTMNIN